MVWRAQRAAFVSVACPFTVRRSQRAPRVSTVVTIELLVGKDRASDGWG